MISVIIINYNTRAMTLRAIDSFINHAGGFNYEIILIDNNSDEKISDADSRDRQIKYIQNRENAGFAKAINQGIEAAAGDYILLLNSDALVEEGIIETMLAYLKNNNQAVIIGPKFIYPDGKNQISSGKFPSFWREFFRLSSLHRILPFSSFNKDFIAVKSLDWVSGGCMLIKREVIEQIGRFDEGYFFSFEDMDFCRRAKEKGWQVIYYPLVKVIHYHRFSSGGRRAAKAIKMERDSFNYYFKKHSPEKIISRFIIRQMYNLRILALNLLGYFKQNNYSVKDATIAITYKCNSRCRMCNIWQIKEPGNLPLEYFYNLSENLRYINLTGGEPFLRTDLPEIVKIVKKASPRAQIIISSNGLATDLIIKQTKLILEVDKKIGIRISLDGIGAVHDQVRGLGGFYDSVLETVRRLGELGVKNLGFSFTIMDFNADQMKAVYDLSKKMNLELALALAQNSDIYFRKADNEVTKIDLVADGLNYIISQELKSFKVKRWLRAYYDYGLLTYLKSKTRLLKSGAGFDSLFVDASGEIYPSNLINLRLGNLKDAPLDKTWNSGQAGRVRREIKEKKISESWIICTARGEMRKHWLKIAGWIIVNKFFRNK